MSTVPTRISGGPSFIALPEGLRQEGGTAPGDAPRLNLVERPRTAHAAHAARADILGLVAHELRNALMPIRLAAAQLGAARVDEGRLARLRFTIEQQADLLSRLIGDLLDSARAETGKLRLECVDMDMAAVLARAVAAARPAMAARAQHFALHLPAVTGMRFHGDPVRLLQIIGNLLDNASKYTPDGGRISMSVEMNAERILITVSDTGIGIGAESLARIFEPYAQADRAVRFNGSGLGIGLSLVRELVMAHGGKVMARSAGPGLGSQFAVILPVDPPEPRADRQSHACAAALGPAAHACQPAALPAPDPGEAI